MAIEIGHEQGLADCHADGRVTANAEVAGGAVHQLEDRPVHRVEHGRELGIAVGRHRPLAIVPGVAGLAGLRGREPVLQEEGRVRVFLEPRFGDVGAAAHGSGDRIVDPEVLNQALVEPGSVVGGFGAYAGTQRE